MLSNKVVIYQKIQIYFFELAYKMLMVQQLPKFYFLTTSIKAFKNYDFQLNRNIDFKIYFANILNLKLKIKNCKTMLEIEKI